MATFRFAVIGIGHFGKHYVRLLQDIEDVELRAVVGRSQETFEKIAEFLPPCIEKFTDLKKVLADPEIDSVVIATPVSSHFPLVRDVLLAGKNVLVEKPMTRTIEEAWELREVIQERNHAFSCRKVLEFDTPERRQGSWREPQGGSLQQEKRMQAHQELWVPEEHSIAPESEGGKLLPIFMVGHQYLYNDYICHLKAKIEQGIFGKIRYLFTEHFYPGPIRSDLGCFWETAPHELSIIEYLFGIQKIIEVKGKKCDFLGSGRDDFTSVVITYENGLVVTIVTSWFAPIKARRMIVGGEKGMVLFDDREPKDKLKFFLYPYPMAHDLGGSSSFYLHDHLDEMVIPAIEAREPLRVELEHFVECIRTGTVPLTDIEHGVRTIESLYLISKQIG